MDFKKKKIYILLINLYLKATS